MDVRLAARLDVDTLDAWRALVARDPEATPFSAPCWVQPWMARFGGRARLMLLGAWSGGALTGAAALAAAREGPARVLASAAQRDADHWDMAAEPARRDAVVEALVDHLVRLRARWDLLVLEHVPAGGTLERALRASPLRVGVLRRTTAPRLELPDSFDAYLDALPKRRRARVRRSLRRVDEGEVRVVRVSDPQEIARTLETWQAMRRRQFAGKPTAINSVHLSRQFGGFLAEALSRLGRRGNAVVERVETVDGVVGVFFSLADERTLYAYQGGYEPHARSLGVGRVVDAHSIRASIAAGRRVVDFGRGGEDYKYWYGARDRELVTLVCGHRSPVSTLAFASRMGPAYARRTGLARRVSAVRLGRGR